MDCSRIKRPWLVLILGVAASMLSSCSEDARSKAELESPASMTGRSQAIVKSAETSKTPIVLARTSKVKVFLVAAEKTPNMAVCSDSLVAVERPIKPTLAPLRAALEELLVTPKTVDRTGENLENYWKGTDLRLHGVELQNGIARIDISGQLLISVGCDASRIVHQIEATARQFRSIKSVSVTVNGSPLSDAVRQVDSGSPTTSAEH